MPPDLLFTEPLQFAIFLLGTSSMNSKLTGEGDGDDVEVPKKTLQFSAINSDF